MTSSTLIDFATRIESRAPGDPELGAAKEVLHFINRRIKTIKREQTKAAKEGDFKEVQQAMSQIRTLTTFRKKTEKEIQDMKASRGSSAAGWTANKKRKRRRTKRRKKRRRSKTRKRKRRRRY